MIETWIFFFNHQKSYPKNKIKKNSNHDPLRLIHEGGDIEKCSTSNRLQSCITFEVYSIGFTIRLIQ
jgi:hypothetical protein